MERSAVFDRFIGEAMYFLSRQNSGLKMGKNGPSTLRAKIEGEIRSSMNAFRHRRKCSANFGPLALL